MTAEYSQCSIILPTPLPGNLHLGVVLDVQGIKRLEFLPADTPLRQGTTALQCQLEKQLKAYFDNPAITIDIPLQPVGTPYQQRVWQLMRKIPVGAVACYGELAGKLASGPRAVAAACRANPIPLLIPCHRVVAKVGLGGYMGQTDGEAMLIKQWLLHHEGAL